MELDLMRELAAADLAALGERGFPVFAARAAGVDGTVLSSWERHGPALVRLVLAAGDAFGPEGPWLEVRTADEAAELAERPLREVVQDERDRLREHAGLATEPGEATEPDGAVVVVDGAELPVRLRREGALWAARLRTRGVSLTVVARGVEPGAVELHEVADLEPYALGRQQLLVRLRERRGRPAEPPEEPLSLDAHRRLVDFCVAHAVRVEAVTEHQEGVERQDLWERAVRQQMRLAGEDREAADEAVSSLVSQMIALALSETWFPTGPEGERAREESIRFTAFASEVPSAPAQRAWRTDAEPEAWLALWRRWRAP